MGTNTDEHVVGLPHLYGGDSVQLSVVESLVGAGVIEVINESLNDGEEVVISGSTVQVGIQLGGYVVDGEGSVSAARSSDTDIYVSAQVYDRLISVLPGELIHKKFSTEVTLGDRRLDIINVDELEKNWRQAIGSLLEALEKQANLEPQTTDFAYRSGYTPEAQSAIRDYISDGLRSIIDSLEGDSSPVNFLRYNGLTNSEALSVTLSKESNSLNAVVNDPTDTLRDGVLRRSNIRQYKNEHYLGLADPTINLDSLSGVLLYTALLDGHLEVPEGILPYKFGTSLARLARTVSERKMQLAGMYRIGECSLEDVWYNALFQSAQRIVSGDYPIVSSDIDAQSQVEQSVRYQMQEEFARAVSQDLPMAVVQMCMSTPLAGMISPALADAFNNYHRLVLPNSVEHASFLRDGRYINKRGEDAIIDDVRLEQVRSFILNLLQVDHELYPRQTVVARYAGDLNAGAGLNFERYDGPKSMSEAAALIIFSMKCVVPQGKDISQVDALTQERIDSICENWTVAGPKVSSFTSTIKPEFDMSVNKDDVISHLQDIETKVAELTRKAAETPHP